MAIFVSNCFLACKYIDIKSANKLGEIVAIVTGVKNYDEMLSAKIIEASDEAKKLGIKEGDLVLDFLMKIY